MKVVSRIEDIPLLLSPIALTIGVFDGVHLGHQHIIKALHRATRKGGTRALFTFSNHPSRVLNPSRPTPLLISFEHRLELLKKYGIDLVIAPSFSREFSNQSYQSFLSTLHAKLPFNHLILGEGAAFGKDREGDSSHLKELQAQLGFEAQYLKKERHHREMISSGLIRGLIQEGKLKKIKKRLGRPYSIWSPFDKTEVIKENDVLYSWTYTASDLCLLPSAVYGVDMEWEGKTLPAIACVRGQNTLNGTHLSVTLYFEKEPPQSKFVNLSFVEYLHSELDSGVMQPNPVSLLKSLSTQPSLS